jgi:hypothetical protein
MPNLPKRGLRYLLRGWRPRPPGVEIQSVPIDQLLCGGEHGILAAQYARHTGNLLRPSTPISCSPHTRFLEQYLRIGEEIFSPFVFRDTAYFANAVECMNLFGEYFTCVREEEVEHVARRFVARLLDEPFPDDTPGDPEHFSSSDSTVIVCPIKHSNCFEVIDGNHRLAIAFVRGERIVRVEVVPPAVLTPLQQLLLDVLTCSGRPELHQPVASPELGDEWVVIRRCSDRFEMMKRFLNEHGLMPSRYGATYLDIACSYGWFAHAFGQLGFDAHGVEMDKAAVAVGRLAYGLEKDQVVRSEPATHLRSNQARYDITSCLSLLHNFILGRASISAEEMLRLIDRATGTALFFEMGQSHEAPFSSSLAGWDADRIEQWLRDNSSFTKIYRLGTDQDNVPPFADNYGRTLFACMR